MSKLGLTIAELHRCESRLARDLRSVAARHHNDQDVCHLARGLAVWSDEHVKALADHGRRHGLRLSATVRRPISLRLQELISNAVRGRPEPALLLLVDLRRIHRAAAGASLDWELLSQGAQAAKNAELLAVADRCHPQSLRQMRWANAMLKELSPQVLAS